MGPDAPRCPWTEERRPPRPPAFASIRSTGGEHGRQRIRQRSSNAAATFPIRIRAGILSRPETPSAEPAPPYPRTLMSTILRGASRVARPVELRVATSADREQLVRVLTRAFIDDPVTRWFVRQDRWREQRCDRLFRWFLNDALPHGMSYTTADLRGAALWVPPGKWKLPLLRQLMLLPEILRIAISRIQGGTATSARTRSGRTTPCWCSAWTRTVRDRASAPRSCSRCSSAATGSGYPPFWRPHASKMWCFTSVMAFGSPTRCTAARRARNSG